MQLQERNEFTSALKNMATGSSVFIWQNVVGSHRQGSYPWIPDRTRFIFEVAGWRAAKYLKPSAPSLVTACLKLSEVVRGQELTGGRKNSETADETQ
eukprot:3636197-Pleurochrysis_carterae.AAC.2